MSLLSLRVIRTVRVSHYLSSLFSHLALSVPRTCSFNLEPSHLEIKLSLCASLSTSKIWFFAYTCVCGFFSVLLLLVSISTALHNNSYIFIGATQEHTCALPANSTDEVHYIAGETQRHLPSSEVIPIYSPKPPTSCICIHLLLCASCFSLNLTQSERYTEMN